MLKLDYTLNTPEERLTYVNGLVENNEDLSERQLEVLADYLIMAMDKEERRSRHILTENRSSTINKRETSYEGLASQFEAGEDTIYNLATDDRNQIFSPKVSITKRDLEEIPFLRQLRDSIEYWEARSKCASGREAYIIKRTLIDLRKDQYVIKTAYRRPITFNQLTHSKNFIPLQGEIFLDFDFEGYPFTWFEGVSLTDPKCCSAILCNYSRLKQDSWGNFESDTWYLVNDFETVADRALRNEPLLYRLMELKIDGLQNHEIADQLQLEFGIKHSNEYLSCLWRKKIPALIASAAEDEYFDWYFLNEEKGTYKRCSKCGQVKLAMPKYFSRNSTAKDKLYSVCKACRNKKGR